VSGNASRLYLSQLGPSEQAAIRSVLDTFRDHGWRDTSNAALAVVRALAGAPKGLTASGVAAVLPDRFYVQNDLTKKDLAAVLEEFAALSSPTRRKRH
jgi:hypothetical protein